MKSHIHNNSSLKGIAQTQNNYEDIYAVANEENKDKHISTQKDKNLAASLYGYTLDELSSLLTPSFRAKQIYHWLYHRYERNINAMDNISKATQNFLQSHFTLSQIEIVRIETSRDGSKKYLFRTYDGHSFESVLIQMREKQQKDGIEKPEKWTMCLSSQIGCKVGCTFCFTAKGGFVRNLHTSEIVEQVVVMKRDNHIASHKKVNIVFMGMGEPLDNLENVSKAIKILSDPQGLSISTKRQTISTSGIAPKIKVLGDLNLGVQLAISLHAVDDELRSKLMPINKAYNIAEVLKEVRAFPVDTRKRVMFEYLIIKDVNDDLKSAKKLLSLLNGIKAKVNLILFNPHEGSTFERPQISDVKTFADFLVERGLLCTIRESKGIDISAACGQLREKVAQENGEIVVRSRKKYSQKNIQEHFSGDSTHDSSHTKIIESQIPLIDLTEENRESLQNLVGISGQIIQGDICNVNVSRETLKNTKNKKSSKNCIDKT
ncbi:23S rRNA (adenine(2503)-C(2))-methyltransferase RlmN [Helicobacter japonicus]|uniref:Probable dual-specificity RNA methyltransferase RlmN n=1 Tax=Helicobacter japonicus TaxID=425400 RepID=A0A4U8TQC4_9HELI|nr:23S rRNA (adenine(2503)-C(2))-methyltransferase RlmN [Helicobacter japonicus]